MLPREDLLVMYQCSKYTKFKNQGFYGQDEAKAK